MENQKEGVVQLHNIERITILCPSPYVCLGNFK